MGLANIGPELLMGMASLFAHKLRSLLTMLGMIFGVGAVVAMLSITAGAQKEMMSFIDQLGVNNIIVEAHEAVDRNDPRLEKLAYDRCIELLIKLLPGLECDPQVVALFKAFAGNPRPARTASRS